MCVRVSVNERLDPSFSFREEFPPAGDRGNANDSRSAYSYENGVLICPNNTVGCFLLMSVSVSTLSRRDCLVLKVDYTCYKAWGIKCV